MKRFILLSFGFLGWAFYEMSGGADFEPASARLAPAPAIVVSAVDATQTEDAAPAAATTETVVDTDPPAPREVTRVSLNLTTLEEATDEEEETSDVVATVPAETNIDPETGVALNTGLSLSSADTPAIIPSLIAPNDTGAALTQDASAQGGAAQASITNAIADIRTVSGNRVNVRGGPGTNFDIVGRLVRGDSVEIIEDNGNGWVLMRALNSDEQGWLADFLLNG